MASHRFALVLDDTGELAEPPVFVTSAATWEEGDTFYTDVPRRRFRVVAILPMSDEDEPEVREAFDALWVVEPVDPRTD
jgi:hypothetical protein